MKRSFTLLTLTIILLTFSKKRNINNDNQDIIFVEIQYDQSEKIIPKRMNINDYYNLLHPMSTTSEVFWKSKSKPKKQELRFEI